MRGSDPPPRRDAGAPIDYADFEERIGDVGLHRRLAGMFDERIDGALEALRASLERADARAVAAQAHELKGMAANIAASQVRRAAAALERAALERDLDEARRRLPPLEASMGAAREEIRAFRRSGDPSPA